MTNQRYTKDIINKMHVEYTNSCPLRDSNPQPSDQPAGRHGHCRSSLEINCLRGSVALPLSSA